MSSSILVPADRTMRQAPVGFCRNPKCLVDNKEFRFHIDHDRQGCPKCGADKSPMVGLLVLIHIMIQDPAGLIKGKGGLRWRLACDPKRAYLATRSNHEAATDNHKIANCFWCLSAIQES